MTKYIFLLALLFFNNFTRAQAILSREKSGQSILLANNLDEISILYDQFTPEVVKNSAGIFIEDLGKIGVKAALKNEKSKSQNAIIVGTINDPLIQGIIKKSRLKIAIDGKWEHYHLAYVANPIKGIKHALLIIGSDARGVAFGIFEASAQMGVSPWNWWADVPVQKTNAIYINKNVKLSDGPKVKYRGIFINDEAPALSNWSKEKFGGFNHKFYEQVFILMLRLKANYIWPAMWGNAFYDDDPLNKEMAKKYGIVIGTSHHEPLMRAHDEWRRYGDKTAWNYVNNLAKLSEFWKEGVARADHEKIVTVGMRGDGDEPMTEDVAIELLNKIITDQRTIIEEVTQKPARETPQIWALYKEVQTYYDNGMRVPEDITLLFCDDNWGNVRMLPDPKAPPRPGGYGMYYHFDYVGGPRNYKWLNTNFLPRIWDQMTLCYQNGIDRIWIVNVGDIKPMELPIQFFLDLAWNPDKIQHDDIKTYLSNFSTQQFGKTQASEIAEILFQSSKLINIRKAELLSSNTFTLTEFQYLIDQFDSVQTRSDVAMSALDAEYRDAYFQLVHHPIEAMNNLYKMYFNQALNHQAYYQKSSAANKYADKVAEYFTQDSVITAKYHQLNAGKWNHMMSQTHIGYTYWQQPPLQVMPKVYRQFVWEFTNHQPIEIPAVSESKALSILDLPKAVSNGAKKNVTWNLLKDYSRYGDAVSTSPFNHSSYSEVKDAPYLEFEFDWKSVVVDSAYLHLQHSPTLDVFGNGGLKIAVSLNDQTPDNIPINSQTDHMPSWENWVAKNMITTKVALKNVKKGQNNIKIYHLDPGIILQRVMIIDESYKETLLGPLSNGK
jgi:hypothetical protein